MAQRLHLLPSPPPSSPTGPGLSPDVSMSSPTGSLADFSTTSKGAHATLRDAYQLFCSRMYSNIVPQNDLELVTLASREYDPARDGSDFHAFMERHINGNTNQLSLHDATSVLDEKLDTPLITGMKPAPGDSDVRTLPTEYSIRMWGTGLEARFEYCFDFVETSTDKPVNSPFGDYQLLVTPNKKTPWLPGPATELYSLERNYGLAQNEILEGEERFVLLEGTACLLIITSPPVRVYFEAPVRPRTVHLGDVREFDFPSEFYSKSV